MQGLHSLERAWCLRAWFFSLLMLGLLAWAGELLAEQVGGTSSVGLASAQATHLTSSAPVPQVLKVPMPQSDFDVLQDYYTGILRLALIKGAQGRRIPQLQQTSVMEQGRAAYELNRGVLADIFWMGTSIKREQQLRAIRIPLERGLIGYRRLIIRTDRLADFASIGELAQLKERVACQGLDWPDVGILRAASLPVTVSPGFEGLFQQLVAGRCDYFPRGYFEAEPELQKRAHIYPQLQQFDGLLLHYPFAVYFFVRKENEALAQWIEQGLEQMIDQGELLAYMQRHPLTAHVFPLTGRAEPKHCFEIANPLLPSDTPYTNPRYWFQPADFMASAEPK